MPACPLLVIAPPEAAIAATLETADGARQVAAASLVRVRRGETCASGVPVEIISDNYRYRQGGAPFASPGAAGCIDPGALAPLWERALLAMAPPPDAGGDPLPSGALLQAPWRPECGADALKIEGHGSVPLSALAWTRPLLAGQRAAVESVQQAYQARFGPIDLGRIPYTDWGYVGLPLPTGLTSAEIARLHQEERLATALQREKVTTEVGPVRDGEPVYTHFTGADPRYSDLYGLPEAVIALLALADGWATRCRQLPAPASPRNCTLQIGDLAWYRDVLPDPLGHLDHHQGTCVDLRLFRSDGSRYEAWWNQPDDRPGFPAAYSRKLTLQFLRYTLDEHPIQWAFFNDPAVREALPFVEPRKGHDDHLHVCFKSE